MTASTAAEAEPLTAPRRLLRAASEAIWARTAAPVALGALTSFAQAPWSVWSLALLGPACALALAAEASSRARAALVGWLFGVGYFLPGLLWIGEAFLVDAERFAWMRPFAVTVLPMGLALFWAAAFAAAPRRMPLMVAAAWSLSELARGHVLTGLPWGLFAYAWVETPVAQAAAWIGPYGLTAATLAASALLAIALRSARPLAPLGLAIGLVATVAALGWARLAATPLEPAGYALRLVQPDVPQREKWVPELQRAHMDRLVGPSEAPAPDGLAYIVWPETATPLLLEREPEFLAALMARLPAGVRLVVGAFRAETPAAPGAEQRIFNSVHVIGAGGAIEATYDKHHLVPFGEFLPFQETLEALGLRQLAGGLGSFARGPGPAVLRPTGGPAFAPLICYEAVFPDEMPGAADRPDLLLQVTNDAWFGDSSGPWQHLAQARFRAIETGLPLARSANTGVSALVDPLGGVVETLGVGARGAIDVRPAAPVAPTLYGRFGETGLGLILAALALSALLLDRRGRR